MPVNSIPNKNFTNYKMILDEDEVGLIIEGYPGKNYDDREMKNRALRYYSGNRSSGFDDVIRQSLRIINSMDGFYANNPATSTFYEGNSGSPIPAQGWKVHISAKDFKSYMKLCEDLIPYLNESKIPYKIVNPVQFGKMEESSLQHGKYITIYAGNAENLHNLLSALPDNILQEVFNPDVSAVAGEINVGGGIFARYGSFVSDYVVAPNGAVVKDERGVACPDWVNRYDFIKKSSAPITRHISLGDVAMGYFDKIDSWKDQLCDWFCGHQNHESITSLYDIGNSCVGLGHEFNDIYDMITGTHRHEQDINVKNNLER